ncbi:pyrroloquinoline-quinone synthase [Acrasis kona]|uniref:Pyrroloquinoline-quinone synthase n=1 Tax=Acrasis kona TaxID=1008807 RepID=A0AAW2Z0K5_9EUKA
MFVRRASSSLLRANRVVFFSRSTKDVIPKQKKEKTEPDSDPILESAEKIFDNAKRSLQNNHIIQSKKMYEEGIDLLSKSREPTHQTSLIRAYNSFAETMRKIRNDSTDNQQREYLSSQVLSIYKKARELLDEQDTTEQSIKEFVDFWNVQTYFNLGSFYYVDLEDYDQAQHNLAVCINSGTDVAADILADPQHFSSIDLGLIMKTNMISRYMMAKCLLKSSLPLAAYDKFSDSIKSYNKLKNVIDLSIQDHKRNIQCMYHQGSIELELKNYNKALHHFKQALDFIVNATEFDAPAYSAIPLDANNIGQELQDLLVGICLLHIACNDIKSAELYAKMALHVVKNTNRPKSDVNHAIELCKKQENTTNNQQQLQELKKFNKDYLYFLMDFVGVEQHDIK